MKFLCVTNINERFDSIYAGDFFFQYYKMIFSTGFELKHSL